MGNKDNEQENQETAKWIYTRQTEVFEARDECWNLTLPYSCVEYARHQVVSPNSNSLLNIILNGGRWDR